MCTCTMSGFPRSRTRRRQDRKSTRLNSSHLGISYAVFCLKKKKKEIQDDHKENWTYDASQTNWTPMKTYQAQPSNTSRHQPLAGIAELNGVRIEKLARHAH